MGKMQKKYKTTVKANSNKREWRTTILWLNIMQRNIPKIDLNEERIHVAKASFQVKSFDALVPPGTEIW